MGLASYQSCEIVRRAGLRFIVVTAPQPYALSGYRFENRDAVRLVSGVEPIRQTTSGELSWSRYRLLIHVEDPQARY